MSRNHNEIIATPEAFVAALVGACEEFTEEVKKELEDGLETIGAESVEEVKRLAPVYEGDNKNTPKGSYKRSWTYTVTKERGKIEVNVHSKNKNYRLTHLLENGHVLRDGTGRKVGEAKAFPHIGIANEHAEKKVDKLLEGLVNGT